MSNKKYTEIKIPSNIDEKIATGVQKAVLEKSKITRNSKKKVVGTVVASLVAILTLGVANPALAAKLPIIGNVFESVEKNLVFPGGYSEYATSVNETAYSNGIGITLSEIFCDGQLLYVSYIVESEEPFKYTSIKVEERDGEIIKRNQLGLNEAYATVDFSHGNLETVGISGLDGEFIDDNTFVGVQQYDLSSLNVDIPDEFIFKTKKVIVENSANNINDESYKKWGTWGFKVPVKVNKEMKNIVKPNDINENGVGIKTISTTPYTTIINATIENYNRDDYSYEMVVYDNFGEELLQRYLRPVTNEEIKGLFTNINDNIDEIRVVITRQPSKLTDDNKETLLDTKISIN